MGCVRVCGHTHIYICSQQLVKLRRKIYLILAGVVAKRAIPISFAGCDSGSEAGPSGVSPQADFFMPAMGSLMSLSCASATVWTLTSH